MSDARRRRRGRRLVRRLLRAGRRPLRVAVWVVVALAIPTAGAGVILDVAAGRWMQAVSGFALLVLYLAILAGLQRLASMQALIHEHDALHLEAGHLREYAAAADRSIEDLSTAYAESMARAAQLGDRVVVAESTAAYWRQLYQDGTRP